MSNYDNNNRGALWKNEKRANEKHPQLRGQAEVDGKEYWVSAWTSKEGGNKPIVSFSLTLKEEQQNSAQSSSNEYNNDDFSEDIPF